jgi:hypothetical protein
MFILVAALALAMEPIPGEDRFEGLVKSEDSTTAGAGLGIRKINEDWFLNISPRFDLSLGKIGLGIQVPLNLRVADNDPENDDDFAGILREEDWDEPSEYLRAIRYFRYGHKKDLVFFRIGELAARIGHGTVVDRYMNNLNPNTFRLGMQLDLNTDYGGFETLVGDVGMFLADAYPHARLVGGRFYVKPMALLDPTSLLNIFQIGFSYVQDSNAPYLLKYDGDDLVVQDNLPVVTDERVASVYGFDVDVDLLKSAMLDVNPYLDVNFISEAGWGLHLGTMVVAKLPVGLDLTVPIRLEYRRFKSNYFPTYFGSFYDLERYGYPIGRGTPKAFAARNAPDDDGLNGYYGDLAFDFAGLVQVGGLYEDYDNQSPSVAFFASVPASDTVQAKAYYERTGIEDAGDLFALDDRSILIAQLRYKMFMGVYAVGRLTRTWQRDADSGALQTRNDWNFGAEASFAF